MYRGVTTIGQGWTMSRGLKPIGLPRLPEMSFLMKWEGPQIFFVQGPPNTL